MKTITAVCSEYKMPITGGHKYDAYLFSKLKHLHQDFYIVSDEKLNFYSKKSFLYNLVYFKKIRRFLNSQVLLINSRLYPRLIFFLFFYKLLKPQCEIIMIHHHYNFMTNKGFKKRLHKLLELIFLKMAKKIIIPSNYIKDLTKTILPNKEIIFLEIAFNKSNITKEVSTNPKNKFLFVGTIEKRKGIHFLIKALKSITIDFHLDLVGHYVAEDEYYNSLKTLIREYKLENKVSFRGRVAETNLVNYFTEASMFVFPSLHEGYGMVIMEAMSFGLPVIAFNNSAIPYTVKNNINGFLVKNSDVDDLSNKITHLSTNKTLLKKMSFNARKTYLSARSINDLDTDIKNFYYLIN